MKITQSNIWKKLTEWGLDLKEWGAMTLLSFPFPFFHKQEADSDLIRDLGSVDVYGKPGESVFDVAARIIEYHLIAIIEAAEGKVPSDSDLQEKVQVLDSVVRTGPMRGRAMDIYAWEGIPVLMTNQPPEWVSNNGRFNLEVYRIDGNVEGDQFSPHPTSFPS